MAKNFTLECNHCGDNFFVEAVIDEEDYYDTGIPCESCENCITYVMEVHDKPTVPLKNEKKVKVTPKKVDIKFIDPEPPYPPLPKVEKTDRELLLEVLKRLEKVEQKLNGMDCQ